jgi:hypothetical protein
MRVDPRGAERAEKIGGLLDSFSSLRIGFPKKFFRTKKTPRSPRLSGEIVC